jgi:hypothetical protein
MKRYPSINVNFKAEVLVEDVSDEAVLLDSEN